METTISSNPARIGIPFSVCRPKSRWCSVVCVTTPPSTSTNGLKTKSTSDSMRATFTTKTIYNDNWIDHLAINYLSQVVQDTTGMRNDETGYEGLVVATAAVFRSFDIIQQRELIVKALQNAIPTPIASMIRTLMRPSKFSREYFAAFTTVFFPWLVGPCEVRESDFEGCKERNVVYIKKCRFLEETNCVGMCTNLCKMPSQEFIKNSFGIPINMVPNFDDMSCEMIFGQNPPMPEDDPAFKQPCYKLCNVKQKHGTSCIS